MTSKAPILEHGENMAIGLIAVLYAVGLIGMLSDWRPVFQLLTPLTLILSGMMVGLGEKNWNRNLILVLVGCLVAGYLVEVVGVATGTIFGVYTYGETLGIKLFDVPLVIGLNWALLVYSTGMITTRLPMANPFKAAAGAALMTGLDFFMEPVAIELDFWSWETVEVPVRNYVAWFLTAYVMLRVFHSVEHHRMNRVAVGLFVSQLLFFGLLWAIL